MHNGGRVVFGDLCEDPEAEEELSEAWPIGLGPCLVALDNLDSYDKYKVYLREHPLFTISQKSHELFHSGMLAWMIKKYPRFAGVFFNELDYAKNGELIVETELDHLDVVIMDCSLPDKIGYYVIENKFKSFFTVEQIERYSSKLNSMDSDETDLQESSRSFKAGVVLGVLEQCCHLGCSTSHRLPHKWSYVSYMSILAGLHERFTEMVKAKTIEKDGADYRRIKEYLEFLDALLSVILYGKGEFELENALWHPDEGVARLENRSFDAFLLQMRAHAFVAYYVAEKGLPPQNLCKELFECNVDCPFAWGDQKVSIKISPWCQTIKDAEFRFEIVISENDYKCSIKVKDPRPEFKKWADGQKLKEKECVYTKHYEKLPGTIDFKDLAEKVESDLGWVCESSKEVAEKLGVTIKKKTRTEWRT